MLIKDIKPLRSDKYKIAIIDPNKGYFMLIRLSDERQSPIYNDKAFPASHILAYECFKESHDDGDKFFNGLCDLESSKWDH